MNKVSLKIVSSWFRTPLNHSIAELLQKHMNAYPTMILSTKFFVHMHVGECLVYNTCLVYMLKIVSLWFRTHRHLQTTLLLNLCINWSSHVYTWMPDASMKCLYCSRLRKFYFYSGWVHTCTLKINLVAYMSLNGSSAIGHFDWCIRNMRKCIPHGTAV